MQVVRGAKKEQNLHLKDVKHVQAMRCDLMCGGGLKLLSLLSPVVVISPFFTVTLTQPVHMKTLYLVGLERTLTSKGFSPRGYRDLLKIGSPRQQR